MRTRLLNGILAVEVVWGVAVQPRSIAGNRDRGGGVGGNGEENRHSFALLPRGWRGEKRQTLLMNKHFS